MHRERTGRPAFRQPVHRWLMLVVVTLLATAPAWAEAQGGATPAVAPATNAMQEMFGRVPAQLPELEDQSSAIIAYVDIKAQIEAVGVTPPSNMDDPSYDAWLAATANPALPRSASPFGNYTREDYGFDLLQADQALSIALPPFSLTLLQGRFDQAAVLQALETAGYQPVEVGGHELLSLRGDFEMDVDAPKAFRMPAMNFAVILDDGSLAFASAGAPLAAVLNVAAGTALSMMEVAGMAMLLDAAPPDLVSAVVVQGTSIAGDVGLSLLDEGTPDVSAIATEISETSEMPPVVMVLLGATAGGPLGTADDPVPVPEGAPEAHAVAVLLMLSPEAAEAAVPIIEERLDRGESRESGEPFTTMFPERSVVAVEGAPAVLMHLAPGDGVRPFILMNMLFSRDLSFLAW